MDESQKELRLKLDESKAQLFGKLQQLEDQISETIASTGMKVESTMEAAQRAVHSAANLFNVQRHFERHPWLSLGMAMAVGYTAGTMRAQNGKPSKPQPLDQLGGGSEDHSERDAVKELDPSVGLAALSAAYELGSRQSSNSQTRSLVLNATVRIFEEIASRSIPLIIAYYAQKQDRPSQ